MLQHPPEPSLETTSEEASMAKPSRNEGRTDKKRNRHHHNIPYPDDVVIDLRSFSPRLAPFRLQLLAQLVEVPAFIGMHPGMLTSWRVNEPSQATRQGLSGASNMALFCVWKLI